MAIDPFYDSSMTLVRDALRAAFETACSLGAETLSTPALATGYGHLTMEAFAEAFASVVQQEWAPLCRVRLVLRSEDSVGAVRSVLAHGADG